MTLKKLFVVVAAISAGVVLALAAIVGVASWWSSRPTPRDSTSVVATYDGAMVSKKQGEEQVTLRYTLENKSEKDIDLPASGLTVFVRRADGSLYDLRKINDFDQEEVEIPAGERIVWLLSTGFSYRSSKGCDEVQIVDDPDDEHIQAFIHACYKKLKGFRVQSTSGNVLIELPGPLIEAKK